MEDASQPVKRCCEFAEERNDYVTLSLKLPGLNNCEDSRKCVEVVLVGAEHLTINCSIPFEHTWFSAMVSICCKEKLL